MLRSTRQQYHQHIAQVLETQFPDICETQPELLAHHYTEAGLVPQALPYWKRAGQRAMQRSAHAEAIAHLRKGLELLKRFPDTPERAQHELDLQVALGPALMAAKGFAAPEVLHAYARARALCQQVGETPQIFPVLRALSRFYLVRVELQTARELGEQCLALAQRVQDPALIVEAYYALGTALFFLGVLVPSREYLERGIALYDLQQHRSLAFLSGIDPGVGCLVQVAWVLWMLGYPDQALQRGQEALTLARKLSHPYSLVYALLYAAFVHQLRREGEATQTQAEAALTIATEQGFAFLLGATTIPRGAALAEQGQGREGMAQMHQGLAGYRATWAELGQPFYLAPLAEVYRKAGQAEEGLKVLAALVAAVEKTGEGFYEAELHRLKGELLLQQVVPDEHQAGACFQQALAIAHRQEAKSLELRAAMSLARLWQSQGKRTEAHELLAPIYGWFTEGFDTADLQEAKTLLEALA